MASPYLIVPKYLDNTGRGSVNRPEWMGSMVGKNWRNGPQLSGRRVLVLMPRRGHPFRPEQHVVDLGPNDPLKPQIFLPGFGEMDASEMRDLILALEDKEKKRGWFDEQREKRAKQGTIAQKVADYADWLVRRSRGRRTFGPGGQ